MYASRSCFKVVHRAQKPFKAMAIVVAVAASTASAQKSTPNVDKTGIEEGVTYVCVHRRKIYSPQVLRKEIVPKFRKN